MHYLLCNRIALQLRPRNKFELIEIRPIHPPPHTLPRPCSCSSLKWQLSVHTQILCLRSFSPLTSFGNSASHSQLQIQLHPHTTRRCQAAHAHAPNMPNCIVAKTRSAKAGSRQQQQQQQAKLLCVGPNGGLTTALANGLAWPGLA